ncbi:MAG TPA: hypothetical protein PKA64_05055, partial [Myxococcota bacterium]|nr:hypothetical protein [Myxococcota bacterium]
MIAWVVALAWAECGEVALATLTRDMDEALGAFASLDEAAFVGAAARAEAELPCLVEVIDHEAAAEWHVLQAVRAWYADPEHPELARLHLSAAATSGLSASDFADVLVAGSPLGDLRAK